MDRPDWTVSRALDCAEPILLSSRHWYMPWSCWRTEEMRREEPDVWRRAEGLMGTELKSQVILGVGFPFP